MALSQGAFGMEEGGPPLPRIPKGFRPSARGCEARATPGMRDLFSSTPAGLRLCPIRMTQPRWGCGEARRLTQGCTEGIRSNLGLEDEIPLGFSEAPSNPKIIWSFRFLESQRDSALQRFSNPKGIPPLQGLPHKFLIPRALPMGYHRTLLWGFDPRQSMPICAACANHRTPF